MEPSVERVDIPERLLSRDFFTDLFTRTGQGTSGLTHFITSTISDHGNATFRDTPVHAARVLESDPHTRVYLVPVNFTINGNKRSFNLIYKSKVPERRNEIEIERLTLEFFEKYRERTGSRLAPPLLYFHEQDGSQNPIMVKAEAKPPTLQEKLDAIAADMYNIQLALDMEQIPSAERDSKKGQLALLHHNLFAYAKAWAAFYGETVLALNDPKYGDLRRTVAKTLETTYTKAVDEHLAGKTIDWLRAVAVCRGANGELEGKLKTAKDAFPIEALRRAGREVPSLIVPYNSKAENFALDESEASSTAYSRVRLDWRKMLPGIRGFDFGHVRRGMDVADVAYFLNDRSLDNLTQEERAVILKLYTKKTCGSSIALEANKEAMYPLVEPLRMLQLAHRALRIEDEGERARTQRDYLEKMFNAMKAQEPYKDFLPVAKMALKF